MDKKKTPAATPGIHYIRSAVQKADQNKQDKRNRTNVQRELQRHEKNITSHQPDAEKKRQRSNRNKCTVLCKNQKRNKL